MILTKFNRVILFGLICAAVCASAQSASAQEPSQSTRASAEATREDDTNLDTQLYLILATNREVEDGRVPLTLEPAMKRLRETLTFKHYNVVATFLNRVRNGGHLDVSWVGGPFLATANAATGNPSFNSLQTFAKLVPGDGRQLVRLNDLRYTSRVPIITAQATATSASIGGGSTFPVINYEAIGLKTDISMREGEPVVAGTLNVGPSGDAIVVVISAKRSNN